MFAEVIDLVRSKAEDIAGGELKATRVSGVGDKQGSSAPEFFDGNCLWYGSLHLISTSKCENLGERLLYTAFFSRWKMFAVGRFFRFAEFIFADL